MSAVRSAIDHARGLLRPAVDTQAGTELYATEADDREITVSSELPGGPTLPPAGGPTDIEVDQPGHASRITAAVAVLIEAVDRLHREVQARPVGHDPRVDALAAGLTSLTARHDMLVDTVTTHGGRLDELAEELPRHLLLLRVLLVLVSGILMLGFLILVAVAILVVR